MFDLNVKFSIFSNDRDICSYLLIHTFLKNLKYLFEWSSLHFPFFNMLCKLIVPALHVFRRIRLARNISSTGDYISELIDNNPTQW